VGSVVCSFPAKDFGPPRCLRGCRQPDHSRSCHRCQPGRLRQRVSLNRRIGRLLKSRSYPGTGGIWLRRNVHRPDAEFIDWGLARAVAEILNALADGRLVRAP
jgi:hypothetical protein